MSREIFLKLPARSLADMFEKLLRISKEYVQLEVEIPLITVHLKSGRDIVGYLLDYQKNRDWHGALVATGKNRDVCYVLFENVESISIHNALPVSHIISFGNITFAPGPAPTRLEIKSKIKEYEKELQESLGTAITLKVSGKGIPESGDSLRFLAKIIKDTVNTVKNISQMDETRKNKIATLKEIIFKESDEPKLEINEGTIVVYMALANGKEGILSGYDLDNGIEEKLNIKYDVFRKYLEEDVVPVYQKSLQERTECEIEYTIDWNSFDFDALQNIEHQGISYVNETLISMCGMDSFRKEAIHESIEKITLRNIKDIVGKQIVLENKELTITCAWGVSGGYFNQETIQDRLENIL